MFIFVMVRKVAACYFVAVLLAISPPAWSQANPAIPRIAFVSSLTAASMTSRVEAFRRGLSEFGYVEGKNIVVEYRYANGNAADFPSIVAELARLKVAVIVTTGPSTTRPVRASTNTIPVVMGFDPDPVRSGFVASLARPGGNVTGFSTLAPEVSAKQVEALKDLLPDLSFVVALVNSQIESTLQSLREMESTARALRLRLHVIEVQSAAAIEDAFDEARRLRAGAVIVTNNPIVADNRTTVIRAAQRVKLPTIYLSNEFVEEGGLVSYSASYTDLFRRSAFYVDRILKGAKPADLPV